MKLNNKRTLLSAAVASCLMGFGTGVQAGTVGAWANTSGCGNSSGYYCDIDAYAGQSTIAQEFLAQDDFDVLDGANNIVYNPSYGMNEGDILTFTFTNAVYVGDDVALVGWDANNNNAVVATNIGGLDSTNGVSSVKLRAVDLSSLDTSNMTLALCSDSGNCNNNNPYLVIPQGTSNGAVVGVSVSVEAQVVGIIGAAAASGNAFDIQRQLNVTVSQRATSQADVSATDSSGNPAPRTAFVDEAGGSNPITSSLDTQLDASVATILVDNDSAGEVEIGYTFSGDELVLDFTSGTGEAGVISTTAADSYLDSGGATTDGTDYALDQSDIANGVLSVTLGDGTGPAIPSKGGVFEDDVVLTVNGTDAIEERTWTMDATLNFAAEGSVTYATDIPAFSWTSNGTVLTAPFFTLVEGYVPRLYLQNSGDSSVDYVIELISDPDANPPISFISGNSTESGTIDGNSSLLLKMPNLVTGQRGGLVITLAGSCSTISGIFQQRFSLTGDFTHYNLSPSKACTPDLEVGGGT